MLLFSSGLSQLDPGSCLAGDYFVTRLIKMLCRLLAFASCVLVALAFLLSRHSHRGLDKENAVSARILTFAGWILFIVLHVRRKFILTVLLLNNWFSGFLQWCTHHVLCLTSITTFPEPERSSET